MHEMNHNPRNFKPDLLKFPLEIEKDADSKVKAIIPWLYHEAKFPPIAENGTLRNSQPPNVRKRVSTPGPTKTVKELENEKYLTVKEAAIYLNIPVNTLRSKLIAGRKIPFIKRGNSIRFNRTKLDEWMNSQEVEPITMN